MTPLALLLALSLIGSVLSYAFGRLQIGRTAPTATIERAQGALERASLALVQRGALRGLLLLVVPALGLASFGVLGETRGGVSGWGRAAFMLLALGAGAASAYGQARLTVGFGVRGASAAANWLARGSARALRPLIGAAAASAVFGECLGLLGVGAAFSSLYAIRGGFAGSSLSAELALEVVRLLPAFALGAAVMGLSLATTGSIAAAASSVGSARTSFPEASLPAGDARDPALLADLVGTLVGDLLPRALVTYVSSVGATVSLALLTVTSSPVPGTLAGISLALLIRVFGAIGTVCGVVGARASEDEPAPRALLRGQASAWSVAAFGLGAALFWLEREWLGPLLLAGALGLSLSPFLGLLSWISLKGRAGFTREVSEARAGTATATILRGAGAALAGLWPVLLAPAILLAFAEKLSSPAPAPLLFATFVAGALSLTPLSLALGGLSSLAVDSRGLAALGRLGGEPPRRSGSLQDAAVLGHRAATIHGACALALALLAGFAAFMGSSAAGAGALGPALFATGLGVALILVFGARTTQSGVAAARQMSGEVERQLRELPLSGSAGVPPEFTPSYKACLDSVLASARGSSWVDSAGLLVVPFAFCLLLRHTGSPVLPNLSCFGLAALLTGIVVSLTGRTTRAVLAELRRRARGTDAGTAVALAEADAFGELVGVTASASVEALVLVLALTVICLAPLLR